MGELVHRLASYTSKNKTALVVCRSPDETVEQLDREREPPSRSGKRLNLLYATQTGVRPPRFRFFVNDPGLITRDYGYWVENQLRDRFGLNGVPVSIDFVKRS